MSPIFWPLDELAGNAIDQARKRYDALTQSASSMLTEPVLLGHARREFDRAVEPIMGGIKQIGQNIDETVSSARQRFDDATKDFDPTLGLGRMQMQAGYDASTVRNPLGEMQVGTDRPYTPMTSPSRPAFGQAQDVLGGAAQMGRESGMSRLPVIGGAVTGALQGAANVAGGLAGSAQAVRSGNPMGIAGAANSTLNVLPDIARGASTEAQLPEQVFPQISPSTPVLGGLNSPREWASIAAGFAQAPTALENAAMGIAGRAVRPLGSAIGRAIGRTPDLAGAPIGAVAGGVSGAMGGPEDQTWQERATRGAIGAAAGAVVGPTVIRSGKNLVDLSGTLNRLQRLGIAAGEDAGHFLDDDLVGEISRLQAMTQRRLESHQSVTDQIGRLEQEMSARTETLSGPKIERPPSKGMWAGTGRLAESDLVEIADRSGLSPYTPQWYDAVDPATIRDYKANAASRQGPKPLTPRQQMAELRSQHRELTRQQRMLEGALNEDMNRVATLEDRAARAGVALPEQATTGEATEAVTDVVPSAQTAVPEPAPAPPAQPAIRPDDPGATELARAEVEEALAIRIDPNLTGKEKQQRIAAIYDRRPDRPPEESAFLRKHATGRVRPALPTQQADADLATSLPPELEQRIQQAPLVPRTPAEPVGPPLSGYGAEQQQPVPGMGVAPQAPVSNPQATISPQAASTTPPIAPGGTIRPGETAQPRQGIQPPLLSQQQILAADQGPSMSPAAAAATPPPTTPQAMSPLPRDVQNVVAGPLVQPGSPQEQRSKKAFLVLSKAAEKANQYRYVSLLSNTSGAVSDLVTNMIQLPVLYGQTVIGAGIESGLQRTGRIQASERATTFGQIAGYNRALNEGFNPWSAGGAQAVKEAWDVIMHGSESPVATEAARSLVGGLKGLPVEFAYRIRLAADTLTSHVGERMASYSLGFREAERAGMKRGTAEYTAYAADVTRRIQAQMENMAQQATASSREAGRRISPEQGGIAQRLQQVTAAGDKANIVDLAKEAYGISRRLVFQQESGGLGKALQETRGSKPVGWIIPFFKTTYNIGTQGITMSPAFGPLGTTIDIGAGLLGKGVYGREAPAVSGMATEAGSVFTRSGSSAVLPASQRLAQSTLGAMVAMTGALMVAHGMMTDNGPADASIRRKMMDEGWRPLALRTANGYIPVARLLGPLAFPLAFGASLQRMHQEGKQVSPSTAREFAMGQVSQVGLNSGLRDFYNIANVMFSPDPQEQARTIDQVLANTIGQVMPFGGLARQLNQLTDPTVRDPRTIPQRIIAGYPGLSGLVPPRTSETGQVLRRGPGEGYLRGELAQGNYVGAAGAAARAFLPGQEVQRSPGQRKYIGSTDAAMDAEITGAINAVKNWERDPAQYALPTQRQRSLANRFDDSENDIYAEQRRAEAVRRRTRRAQETNATVLGSLGVGGFPPFSPPTVP